jgi:hypothetical protein
MPRIPLVTLALAATLLLAACTAPSPDPAEPLPEGSTLPTTASTPSPDPVTQSRWEPCDEADGRALKALSSGDVLAEPSGDYYPEFLPLPSCVIEDQDLVFVNAFFLPATHADFDALEAAITAEQGEGVPSDGQGMATDGTTWEGQPIASVFLVPPSLGISDTFVFIAFGGL